jgi:indolepyruvate ferredoxin oxidoreductase
MERALIADYEALVSELATALCPDNHALAVELASLPEQIRGFGHIKMRNVEKAKAREADLLGMWRGGDAAASAA